MTELIYQILNTVGLGVLQAIAWMTGYVIQLIVIISQYNTFIDHNIVKAGWSIVRDIANMFFIIGLLVIAAGTVLRLENYRYNRLLGRLIIMAFLVNFSRLIAGFLIQTSQVVMLTFVNAYKEIFFGNVASMFGLEEVLRLARTSGDNAAQSAASSLGSAGTTAVTMGALFVTIIASIVMMIVALVITLAICVVLFVRIIALWILIILSPLAYALRILPNTQGIASQYWKEFGKYVVTGPVLAFFLWLSLAILVGTNQVAGDSSFKTIIDSYKKDSGFMNTFVTSIFNINSIMTFLVSTIFLMMGLKYAQQSGVAGGNFAGKIASTGFGAARGFAATATGYNFIRNRTVRPVQEYFKERRARSDAGVRERAAGLSAGVDRGLSATVGRVGRARAGVTGAVGAGLRGAVQVITRQKNIGEAAQAVVQGTALGLRQGTRGYRQAQARVSKQREEVIRREGEEKRMEFVADEELTAMMNSQRQATRVAAGQIIAKRGHLDAGQARQMSQDLETISPNEARNFRKTVYNRQQDIALEAFHNNLAAGTDQEALLQAIDRGEASQSILKAKLLRNPNGRPNALADQMGQRLFEMHQQKGSLDKMSEGLTDEQRTLLYSNITVADEVDADDRRRIANASGATHRAFQDAGHHITADMATQLQTYLSRNAQKAAEMITTEALQDTGLVDQLRSSHDFRSSHWVAIANRSGEMQRQADQALDAHYGREVATHGVSYLTGPAGTAAETNYEAQQGTRTARFLVNRGNLTQTVSGLHYFDNIATDVNQQNALSEIIASAEGAQLGRMRSWDTYLNAAQQAEIQRLTALNVRYDQATNFLAANATVARACFNRLPFGRLRSTYQVAPGTANLFP